MIRLSFHHLLLFDDSKGPCGHPVPSQSTLSQMTNQVARQITWYAVAIRRKSTTCRENCTKLPSSGTLWQCDEMVGKLVPNVHPRKIIAAYVRYLLGLARRFRYQDSPTQFYADALAPRRPPHKKIPGWRRNGAGPIHRIRLDNHNNDCLENASFTSTMPAKNQMIN